MTDPWRCTYCGKLWPVPSLARDCEARCEPKTIRKVA